MQVYLVGGAVRDQLLGRPIKDKDFVVVGATVADMLAAGFQQVGADFPVFLHPISREEYALARTERKQGLGYQGFSVHASPDVTLHEDLQRRDLTVNAMAIEVKSLTDDTPINGEVVDYYGGLDDIKSKTLRHVSSAFSEDPLRVLRTARFYGRYYDLGFSIADETLLLMRQLVSSGELAHLSSERIWQESSRAIMQVSPQVYWQQLFEIGALTEYFAPLHQVWSHSQYGQIREIAQTALYFAGQMQLNLSQRWALLMASLNTDLFALKPTDLSSNNIATAVKGINDIGNSVKVPKAQTQFATLFVQQAKNLSIIDQLSAAEKIDLIQACSAHKTPEKLSQLLVTSHVLKLAIQHRQMMLALGSFHAIGMNDIDQNLKGPAIGAALRQARIEHLESQHA
ncbi:tRNA nucleotidyltransferase (CCA-adding enzyme) [Psychrobacter luti]|uniref:tRNA nucleotidyltransferase (CCA-adding enzyme) n=1 Tax=Psychrobacter luti TaxID=198481 RepID=A0A839TCB1_9GAMM|nr:tRNA nucleotidyltransferase [Psychrobacter luti]MBB3106066.1 tRNA nucleotidyltransferase (CCA-adding enzyme) [Psychrobacter luti]